MIKKLGIVVVVGLLAAFLVWKFVINKDITNVADKKAAFTTSFEGISKEINANDSIAGAKYDDKIIEISGIIKSLEPGDSTTTVILGDTTGTNDIEVICQIDARNNATAKDLQYGINATLKGRFTGIDNQRTKSEPTEEGEEDLLGSLGGVTVQIKDAAVVKKQ